MTNLCLNMIVKNEEARILRCLKSVASYISCWSITDTGSTDNTILIIKDFFGEKRIPGHLTNSEFVNFGQARNKALDFASEVATIYKADYFLLCDADMELVVDNLLVFEDLNADAYRLIQKGSNCTYRNTRLLKCSVNVKYRGATHEYLDVQGVDTDGAWFIDYADGQNRQGKFERDIVLLEEELRQEPNNVRTVYYLAQSHKDARHFVEAAALYAKRFDMGGWEEEVWSAKLQEARCRREIGDHAGFVTKAIQAYQSRPTRAEPLYDLATHYRNQGQHDLAAFYAAEGLSVPYPSKDLLFVEDAAYFWGLRQELAISGYYVKNQERKERAARICDSLALERNMPEDQRNLARQNLYHYLPKVETILDGWEEKQLLFKPPPHYTQMNCSITNFEGKLYVAERTMNYWLDENVNYNTPNNVPIHSRTFLLQLDPGSLDDSLLSEITLPSDWPKPKFDAVQGFEDTRLFGWNGDLWTISTVREQAEDGLAEQWIARIGAGGVLCDARPIFPKDLPRRHEKNWMPINDGRFLYLCDPTIVLDDKGNTLKQSQPPFAAEHFRGGSQVIEFDEGYLAVIHNVVWFQVNGRNRPKYFHRFVYFDADFNLRATSRAFLFTTHAPSGDVLQGYQYVMGLCGHPDQERLLMSFQVDERESWIGSFPPNSVRKALSLPRKERATVYLSDDWKKEHGMSDEFKYQTPEDILQDVKRGQEILSAPHYETALYRTATGRWWLPIDSLEDDQVKTIKMGEIYSPEILCIAQMKIVDGSTVIDVGASFGQMSVMFSRMVNSTGRVYSFEVEPFIYSVLRQNIAENTCGNVHTHCGPVWRISGQHLFTPSLSDELTRWNAYGCFHLVIPDRKEDENRFEQVTTIAIDDLNIEGQISFMKIDAQGSDLFVMQGARKTIAKHRMPIVFEYETAQGLQSEFGTSWDDYTDFIKEIGYKITNRIDSANFLIEPIKYSFSDIKPSILAPGVVHFGSGLEGRSNNSILSSCRYWAYEQLNRPLQSKDLIERSTFLLQEAGLPLHGDSLPKNWDTFLAVHSAWSYSKADEPVLDAGAAKQSAFLPGLKQLGFTKLDGTNLNREELPPNTGEEYYYEGDITKLSVVDNNYAFVGCLSVLEHGVDWRAFLREMARVIKPGGYLFISVDYWETSIDATHIAPGWHIFGADEIRTMIGFADALGFAPTSTIDLTCGEKVVSWCGLDFTFLNMLFRLNE